MNHHVTRLARRLRMGQLLYHTYHAPKGFLTRCHREGLRNLWLSHRGRREMEAAAKTLPALTATNTNSAPEIHFLSGRKFWYQTCFCAFSLLRNSPLQLRPVIYDDGTLDD